MRVLLVVGFALYSTRERAVCLPCEMWEALSLVLPAEQERSGRPEEDGVGAGLSNAQCCPAQGWKRRHGRKAYTFKRRESCCF